MNWNTAMRYIGGNENCINITSSYSHVDMTTGVEETYFEFSLDVKEEVSFHYKTSFLDSNCLYGLSTWKSIWKWVPPPSQENVVFPWWIFISSEELPNCLRVVTEACREVKLEDILFDTVGSTIHAMLVCSRKGYCYFIGCLPIVADTSSKPLLVEWSEYFSTVLGCSLRWAISSCFICISHLESDCLSWYTIVETIDDHDK